LADRIRALLAVGLSKRAIAVRLGVSESTVYRCLRGGVQRGGPLPAPVVGQVQRAASERHGGFAHGTGQQVGRPLQQASPAVGARSRGAREQEGEDEDDYPEVLLRRVARDFVAILPRIHYVALVRAAASGSSAAAAESLRQAILLHAEPMIPPPTSIELVLSAAEQEELKAVMAGRDDDSNRA
jgi:hypothetical protein